MSRKPSLESLRERCDELGLAYTDRMRESGLLKLIKKAEIQAGKKEKEAPVEVIPEDEPEIVEAPAPSVYEEPLPIPTEQGPIPASKLDRKLEATKLVRVIVRPNDPNKRNNDGDVFSAGNEEFGFITKYVPYNNENGWHVPQIIVDLLKSSKVQLWRVVKLANGMESKEGYLTQAYNVIELPALTKEELKALAESQRQRGAIAA